MSVGRSGYYHYPVIAVKNVDVRQAILLHIFTDGIHISQVWSSSGPHRFYLHVQHCSGQMAFIMYALEAHTSVVTSASGVLLSAVLLPLSRSLHFLCGLSG